METMNIALPEPLKDFVHERVTADGYSSASEYIRELIRGDQKQRAKSDLEAEILRGIASGEARPMTKRDWQRLHAGVKRRTAKR